MSHTMGYSQLSTVGEQALEFVESIEKGVEPLAKALVAEPSDEGAALITKTLAIAQTSAIRALGISILDTAESSRPDGTSLTTENELNADDEIMTPMSAAPIDRPTSGGFSYYEETSSTSEIRIQTINPVPETIKDHGQSPSEPIDVDSL
ncbi:hypothetical protein BDN70DRAFT_873984 [Pholiota conissans]|uniref:Uncharacterized protein n=1 Tax=Pholiota conissans TaxID=109636 RepID=A0A9P5Z8Z6_9AGAR|nr:hypothetical protein BDN70DRAFT_873984 [Pholiota conissans]